MSNTRQPGYYWVKEDENSEWTAALYYNNNGDTNEEDSDWCWRLPNMEGKFSDMWLFQINETRILSPDEEGITLNEAIDILKKIYDSTKETENWCQWEECENIRVLDEDVFNELEQLLQKSS